jgi:antitoxin ParD1/3/4
MQAENSARRTMNIQLTPQSEEILRSKAASGLDPSIIIEEALLLLEDQERFAALRAALAVGEEEIARGEVDLFTPDLFARLRAEGRELGPDTPDADPDVWP